MKGWWRGGGIFLWLGSWRRWFGWGGEVEVKVKVEVEVEVDGDEWRTWALRHSVLTNTTHSYRPKIAVSPLTVTPSIAKKIYMSPAIGHIA